MNYGQSEHALMVNFDIGLQSTLPLADTNRLGSEDFPIPISFFYGSRDWVRANEDDGEPAMMIVDVNKFKSSTYHIIDNADHNIHHDNPE